ncbi:LPS O-antigen length regulator Wzz(fepE) [Citrobacter meridianamericanus]|uniref:LPS O-antigen length regulator Wzz(FepE) n=1 Tax=Citrobacter meridianamericanus TaxID=2894201 RepID=A0ABT1BHC2_9ENTR|nr:LPS O-antigen length regulator Wzz(fepE) [Citrobacter meridianamericanus]MCO5784619.1 LPS O-antigen length regulator Wzz(fepE) [Citrobacter meridianamericanus]
MSSLKIKPDSSTDFYRYPRHETSGGEIDLLSLMAVFWGARKRILAYLLAFALTGLMISFLLPQKWTSNAIVTAPEANQWGPLHQHLAALQVLGVNVDISRDDIFTMFLKKFQSQQEMEEYITHSPKLMALIRETSADAMGVNQAIVAMTEKIKAVNDNTVKKGESGPWNSWTLSFTGPDPQEAQSILKSYTEFVAARVVAQSLESIRDTVALKVQTEKEALELERAKLTNIQDTRIRRLNYALQVAKAAGIIRPVYSNGQAVKDDPDFSVALGADGIARKLEIEKSMTDVAELNAGLRNSEYQLSLLKKIIIKDTAFPVFKYQLSPSLPVKKEGPGKSMITLLATLIGSIFACGSVLLEQAISERRTVLPEPVN